MRCGRMGMIRSRRACALFLALVAACYICLNIWVDLNWQNAIYRVWYINGFPNSSEAGEIACYYDTSHNTLEQFGPPVSPDKGIFFLETSCPSEPGIHLTPRQACAVESAAKMNPTSDVYVLFPSPVVDNISRPAYLRELLSYPNVRLRHLPMDLYFQDSPLADWYSSGMLRTSRWPRSHASDILRYLTLWKFGGIYLDLDVVVTKSLSNLSNFAGAESDEDVAAGVLSFSSGGAGHQMAGACVEELRTDFRGYDWGHNGPGIITKVLKSTCGTENVREMTLERCEGFTVFPPHIFYPIPWRKWRLYFDSQKSEETLHRVAHSHAIHVWNKFSTQANITVGSKQPYGVIASKYCPKVYSHVGNIF
uniref:Alpha 1,4-glycosyltransferase domain-containing protein n=1 Tax=Graphocephala atropunctata TaxID=36148 RepID=A0A1B6KGG8_9HEMI